MPWCLKNHRRDGVQPETVNPKLFSIVQQSVDQVPHDFGLREVIDLAVPNAVVASFTGIEVLRAAAVHVSDAVIGVGAGMRQAYVQDDF